MKQSKYAFTMIEMVFVIVVLGILASIAVPRLAATRTDAELTKGIADVSSIRLAIITDRQSRLIVGSNTYSPLGTGTYTVNGKTYKQMNNGGLFGGVLMYPISASSSNGHWNSSDLELGVYVFKVGASSNTFTYTPADGKFLCTSGNECPDLTN